jgi:hypothetical protein
MGLPSMLKELKETIKKRAQKHYYSARFYYHLRLKREIARQEYLILVYQMGKVGSSTVVRSLSAHNFPSFNVHTFDPFFLKRGQKIFRSEFNATGMVPKTLWDQQLIRRLLKLPSSGKPLKIITLVRDPVARNVSHFFQWPNMIMEQSNSGYHLRSPVFNYDRKFKAEAIADELAELFMTQFKLHERPLIWFDKELKHNFGIDVYSCDFPKKKGYCIYSNGKTDALVIKLEQLGSIAQAAFKEFLGIDSFVLVDANIGREKETSDLYSRFLDSIKLPPDYLDTMYTSRFVEHFYGRKEIDGFRARWSRSA